MKRFASHFLFLPAYGYLKQYAIETEEGIVVRLFPLTEEMENVDFLFKIYHYVVVKYRKERAWK